MKGSEIVDIHFQMNRTDYLAYKVHVVAQGESVKGDLVRYMQWVAQHGMLDFDKLDNQH